MKLFCLCAVNGVVQDFGRGFRFEPVKNAQDFRVRGGDFDFRDEGRFFRFLLGFFGRSSRFFFPDVIVPFLAVFQARPFLFRLFGRSRDFNWFRFGEGEVEVIAKVVPFGLRNDFGFGRSFGFGFGRNDSGVAGSGAAGLTSSSGRFSARYSRQSPPVQATNAARSRIVSRLGCRQLPVFSRAILAM